MDHRGKKKGAKQFPTKMDSRREPLLKEQGKAISGTQPLRWPRDPLPVSPGVCVELGLASSQQNMATALAVTPRSLRYMSSILLASSSSP